MLQTTTQGNIGSLSMGIVIILWFVWGGSLWLPWETKRNREHRKRASNANKHGADPLLSSAPIAETQLSDGESSLAAFSTSTHSGFSLNSADSWVNNTGQAPNTSGHKKTANSEAHNADPEKTMGLTSGPTLGPALWFGSVADWFPRSPNQSKPPTIEGYLNQDTTN